MFKKVYERWNVLVITQGPKAGQLFMVPCWSSRFKTRTQGRKLRLRNAQWLLTNTSTERGSGFCQGYLAGLSGFFPET